MSSKQSSKSKILKNIRNQIVPQVALPDLNQTWITYEDRWAHFREVLGAVGGVAEELSSQEELSEALAKIPAWAEAKKTVSLVPGVSGNVDAEQIDDPHLLEDIDYAVLPGIFGVAENGAVWVEDKRIKHRVLYFLPQHIALVVPAPEGAERVVVDNMHQAYERVSLGENFFGTFISGPSKTADIEQSLVIGAHGARSLHIFFVK
ncbi:MAG: LUD domain-containing protein [Pirellulaceae bacterium]